MAEGELGVPCHLLREWVQRAWRAQVGVRAFQRRGSTRPAAKRGLDQVQRHCVQARTLARKLQFIGDIAKECVAKKVCGLGRNHGAILVSGPGVSWDSVGFGWLAEWLNARLGAVLEHGVAHAGCR